jgi:hypothetical protein
MTHYYFHIRRGQVTVLDQKGAKLRNTADAEKEALRRGRRIVASEGDPSHGKIIVADHNWVTLYEVPFSGAATGS